MNINKLDHVSLLVKDVESTRHFYGNILGLEEVPRPSTFNFPGAWYRIGNQELHIIGESQLGRAAQAHPGYSPEEMASGRGTHFAFQVENLDAAIQHLLSHNIKIVGGPRPRGDGVTQMYICDPDGYLVELFMWGISL